MTRSPEFEKLRQQNPVAVSDKWTIPEGRASIGADIVTRKKRWTFDVRYHGRRMRSKKFAGRRRRERLSRLRQ